VIFLPQPLSAGIIALATMPSLTSLFNSYSYIIHELEDCRQCSKYYKSIVLPLVIFVFQRKQKFSIAVFET
jgi:uncharacterized membrane protein